MKTKNKIAVLIFSLIIVLVVPAVSHAKPSERTISAKDVSSVQVKSLKAVKVTGWDNDQIKVEWDKGSVDIDAKAGAVQIKNHIDGADTISVSMPKNIKLTVKTVNGSITVKDLQSRLRASSVNGYVDVSNCTKGAAIDTVDGEMKVSRVSGELSLRTVSGSLTTSKIKADRLDVKTVSGDIKLRSISANHLKLTSHSGDIDYLGGLSKEGELIVKSFSGDLKIAIPESVGFELSARSRTGTVKVEHSIQVSHRSENRVNGRKGKGGADLTLASFSGDIELIIAPTSNSK
ncbi:MAG: DUF4097 domain-containing protein [Proteobacteria bacterium]|nr:DUF4097 domain-containing protein [Pseudomonadota bacterium]